MAFLKLPDGRVAVGLGTPVWHRTRPNQPSFYAPDFFLTDERPWLTFDEVRLSGKGPSRFPYAERGKGSPFFEPDAAAFTGRVNALLQKIRSGEIQKAVPVVFETAPVAAFEFSEICARLVDSPSLYGYGFEVGDEAMIGATPEILFEIRGRELKTMALAGTAPLEASSLLENPKEMLEHRLVVEDMMASLSALGRAEARETREHKLPGLKHLLTPLHLTAEKPLDVEAVARALHPTPALGGFPRAAAAEWLREQPEARSRRRFGAPFGFVDGDFAFVVVAIRNMQKYDGRWWLGSGCGIVEGSVPEREWRELRLKRDSVRQALGISR